MSVNLKLVELIELLKPLFHRGEFDKVYSILVDHEREVEVKLKNLEKGMNVMKEECWSLENKHSLDQLDKLTYSDKLLRSRRECEDLEEKITRLTEEVRVSSDRLKRAEERYAKVCKEQTEMYNEKNQAIFELNERLNHLSNKIRGRDQIMERFREKLQYCDVKIVQMRNEHQELQSQKSAADQIIEKMRSEKVEVDCTMEDLRRQYTEASETMEKLRRQNLEASDTVEELRLVILAAKMKTKMSYETMKEVVLNDDGVGSSHQTAQQSGINSTQAENNRVERLKGSERFQGSDFIDIGDSDDETSSSCENLSENETLSERYPSSSLTFQNSSHPKRKRSSLDIMQIERQKEKHIRKSTDGRDESLDNGTTQTTIPFRSDQLIRTCEEKGGESCDSQTNLPNFFDLPSDSESTDSDESCPEFSRNDASLQSLEQCKTWMYGVDMLKDFEKDVEICMKAVCALYRREKMTSESDAGSSGGLGHFNAMGGCALAEYLIGGDPMLRLRKSVNEVKDKRPEVLDQCRQLANDYYAKLFSIYCSLEDPFFKPM